MPKVVVNKAKARERVTVLVYELNLLLAHAKDLDIGLTIDLVERDGFTEIVVVGT